MTEPAPRRRSVRARVTALGAVLVFVVLAVAAAVLVVTSWQIQLQGVDDNLSVRADDLEALAGSPGFEGGDLPFTPDTVAQIVEGDRVLAASHSAVADAPMVAAPEQREVIYSFDGIVVDDDLFRVLSREVAGGRVVHVARAIDDLQDARRTVIIVLAVVVPLVTAVFAAGVWGLVGRTLRPVESIRTEVAAMGGDELDRRVPVPPGDDEIARLARTMNEMLERVEAAQARQREFAADASHELRSPLTRIRSELEVDMAHPEGADPLATHRSVLEEVEVLQRMIDDLLMLAREDAGVPTRMAPVDLDDVVLREIEPLRDRADREVDVSGVTAAQVAGDELRLARAVRNLLDNAARHARTRITVVLREVDGYAELSVADDGPGIAMEDRDRVFERFTRVDPGRRRGEGGSGLGLPISRGIAEAHGGSLELDPAMTEGARFVMRLPLHASPDGSPHAFVSA